MVVKYNEAEIKQITNNMPDTIYPQKIEDWYARQIIRTVTNLQRQAIIFLRLHLADYLKSSDLKLDAIDDQPTDPDKYERLARDLDLLAFTLQQRSNNPQVRSIATRFVKSIDAISYKNVKMQAGIVGIDPIRDDFALKNYIKGKIEENTLLIKSMQANYATALQKDIYRSITSGSGVTQVTKAITDRTHMTVNHAKLIANDQTGSVISQLDAYRAKRAGARKYIWRSMEDSRVRPKHRELDGTEQIYDDPDGGDGGQMPGEPIRCRCVALPVFNESISPETSASNNEKTLTTRLSPETEALNLNETVFVRDNPKNIYGVNKSLVNTKQYHDKFEKLDLNKQARESIYREAMKILNHRNNTKLEDVVLLDSKTGNIVVSNYSSTKELSTGLTSKQKKVIDDYRGMLINVHNHPASTRPSLKDLNTSAYKKFATSIIICHDGTIYEYHVDNSLNLNKLYDKWYNVYKQLGYSKEEIHSFVMDKIFQIEGVYLARL